MSETLSRRRVLQGTTSAGAMAVLPRPCFAAEEPIMTRPIPVSGEPLPIVGCGSAGIFNYDAADTEKVEQRRGVLERLIAGGGKLIDTARDYGKSEDRIGELVADMGIRDKLFIATKFRSTLDVGGRAASLRASQVALKTQTFDLMQAWNVSTPDFDLAPVREWKAQGTCRYTGITSSFDSAYDALLLAVPREKPDFFQIDYNLGDRNSEQRLLPMAMDTGCAVLINMPFGGGRNSIFKRVAGVPVPEWAAEFDADSWAQIFLKYLLSHPAVTAVIPGTDLPQYMTDNLGAGRGRMPDPVMRQKIVAYFDSLPG